MFETMYYKIKFLFYTRIKNIDLNKFIIRKNLLRVCALLEAKSKHGF